MAGAGLAPELHILTAKMVCEGGEERSRAERIPVAVDVELPAGPLVEVVGEMRDRIALASPFLVADILVPSRPVKETG